MQCKELRRLLKYRGRPRCCGFWGWPKAPLLLLFSLLAFQARAAWVEKESRSEPSAAAGVVHQRVLLENRESGRRARMDLAIFSPKSCRLRLIDNRTGERRLADVLPERLYIGGVNGGYFDTDFAPLGLRIRNFATNEPLVRGKLLTGVVAAWPDRIRILRAGSFSKKLKPALALQCGPFLVEHGRPVTGLKASREARRTFVGVGTGDRAALGVCSEISLADLAEILSQSPGNLRMERALNLDGGSSSAFWFRRKEGDPLSIPGQKPVRDFLVIEAR